MCRAHTLGRGSHDGAAAKQQAGGRGHRAWDWPRRSRRHGARCTHAPTGVCPNARRVPTGRRRGDVQLDTESRAWATPGCRAAVAGSRHRGATTADQPALLWRGGRSCAARTVSANPAVCCMPPLAAVGSVRLARGAWRGRTRSSTSCGASAAAHGYTGGLRPAAAGRCELHHNTASPRGLRCTAAAHMRPSVRDTYLRMAQLITTAVVTYGAARTADVTCAVPRAPAPATACAPAAHSSNSDASCAAT